MIKYSFFSFIYQKILKRIFFLFDPEFVHDLITIIGRLLGKFYLTRLLIRKLFNYRNSILEQKILGISFANPIGLGGGFDKDAHLTDILPQVGFGFIEVGSITGEACSGNSGKRLWRLPKSKSLLVYYGLKNNGAVVIADKLAKKKFNIPIGINIAKTNCAATVDVTNGIADYVKAYNAFAKIGDYININISCPNAFGGEPFTDPIKLDRLLNEISKFQKTKPIFLKISPDLSIDQLDSLLLIVEKYPVDGLIISNLTKKRENNKIIEKNMPTIGGFSGKVVEEMTNDMISYVYQKYGKRFIIIGLGGVFNGQDAYEKIIRGSSLVQLVTGMIFQGPHVIGQINLELARILRKNGFNSVSEAIGSKYKNQSK